MAGSNDEADRWRDKFQAQCVLGARQAEELERLREQHGAMARLLLKLQWIEHEKDGVSIACCHICNAIAEIEGHRRDCVLAAVLRQAGVTP